MTCYHPITAWYSYDQKTSKGNRAITFDYTRAIPNTQFQIPCGQCIGCRLDRSIDSMVRCVHESKCWPSSVFVTLTYAPEFLPENESLDFRDLTLFWKRLRKHFSGQRIRYFACGEYGSLRDRPHFHAIIFNCDFVDKKLFFRSSSGSNVYRSDLLDDLWQLGHTSIGNVTNESCAYVARYITKKITGDGSQEYVDDDGVVKLKENTRWSRDPFIGGLYLQKYWKDIYLRGDRCLIEKNGRMKKYKVPRAYDKWLAENHPDVYADVKSERQKNMLKFSRSSENTPQRLRVKEELHELRASKLIRNFEI